MSTVQEIQKAILMLPDQDRRKLFDWIDEQEEVEWDEQIARDLDAGKLDALLDRVRDETQDNKLRPSP